MPHTLAFFVISKTHHKAPVLKRIHNSANQNKALLQFHETLQ